MIPITQMNTVKLKVPINIQKFVLNRSITEVQENSNLTFFKIIYIGQQSNLIFRSLQTFKKNELCLDRIKNYQRLSKNL
ncbi:unnamed protein product [Paramecium primaurelia]|uniref:Uncharacterized protein n=1 Tax=Paramecium primaurelia TaxID=5886 RepID=A0A8S1PBN9_PARPR|nr:unnamed protein product [Paramecium primaurelia]